MGKKREPKRIRRQRENARAVAEFQRAIASLIPSPLPMPGPREMLRVGFDHNNGLTAEIVNPYKETAQ